MILSRIIKQSLSFSQTVLPLSYSSRSLHWPSSRPDLKTPSLCITIPAPSRCFHRTTINFQSKSAAEESLIAALASAFPSATDIAVVDVSGGCGAMYEVFVEAPDFAKMRTVKQHQLVTKALASQIKDMHGIRISTAVSSQCHQEK